MAVINPTVDKLMQKATQNSKYFNHYLELHQSLRRRKRKEIKIQSKLPFGKMDIKSKMESLFHMILKKVKSSWQNWIKDMFLNQLEQIRPKEELQSVQMTEDNKIMFLHHLHHMLLSRDKLTLLEEEDQFKEQHQNQIQVKNSL